MIEREAVEKELAAVSRRLQEQEAIAGHALDDLARHSSRIRPLCEIDPDQVRASADTFADAACRLEELRERRAALLALLT